MPPGPTSLARVLGCSLPALLLSAACLLPFLGKAFTIDDPVFLLQAQQIRKAPLHPTAMEICWTQDNKCGPVSRDAPNNLLMSYYLVPPVALAAPERLVHAMQLVTLWFGIVATVSLAFRFGFGGFAACAAGVVLAASPPVLAMASTAMPDVLAMSLGAIGIERLLAFKQERKLLPGILSALALGLAPFTRMHLALLWPIAALLLRDDTHILDVRSWLALKRLLWPVAGAALVWMVAVALTSEHRQTGGLGFFWTDPANIRPNLNAYLVEWMLAMPLGLAWLILRNRRMHFWVLLAICPLWIWKIWIRPGPVLWVTLCAGLGLFVMIDIFLWSFQNHDPRRIACALWLLLPLAALQYMHLPVKYLVPCAPAAALLIAEILPGFHWRTAALCGIAASGMVFGSMVLRADAEFAEMARQAAARLIVPHVTAGHRVWFASQWGFYWYALKSGAQVLKTNDVPVSGDYLARGNMEGWKETLKRLPPAVLVESFAVGGPGGRTMSPMDGAGLYTNRFGNLIWAWGSGEWNRYELWRFQ